MKSNVDALGVGGAAAAVAPCDMDKTEEEEYALATAISLAQAENCEQEGRGALAGASWDGPCGQESDHIAENAGAGEDSTSIEMVVAATGIRVSRKDVARCVCLLVYIYAYIYIFMHILIKLMAY